jgi:hypothetical protein
MSLEGLDQPFHLMTCEHSLREAILGEEGGSPPLVEAEISASSMRHPMLCRHKTFGRLDQSFHLMISGCNLPGVILDEEEDCQHWMEELEKCFQR